MDVTVNGNGFLGNNGHLTSRHSPRLSWLDLRVFYVRISKCEIDDSTPENLTLNHIPLDPNTLLEVNGVRASIYSDGVSTLLRRDRLDKKSEEATYVSTDSIRITGSVKFEVLDRDAPVLSGYLNKCESNGYIDGSESDHVSRMWSMNCETNATVGTGFLKGKQLIGSELALPTIEVYVAGCFLGTPIMLTKSLHLNSRRKQVRMAMLNSIPENDSTESEKESPPRLPVQNQQTPEDNEKVEDGVAKEGADVSHAQNLPNVQGNVDENSNETTMTFPVRAENGLELRRKDQVGCLKDMGVVTCADGVNENQLSCATAGVGVKGGCGIGK
uniref:Erythronate-4-phosphate dehydrogenase family protein n=1 Tax=Chenopodium quinoa TaxID=63459 RepID=A0A803LDR9_CHEQI